MKFSFSEKNLNSKFLTELDTILQKLSCSLKFINFFNIVFQTKETDSNYVFPQFIYACLDMAH